MLRFSLIWEKRGGTELQEVDPREKEMASTKVKYWKLQSHLD